MFRRDLQMTFFERHQDYHKGCGACEVAGFGQNLSEHHVRTEWLAQMRFYEDDEVCCEPELARVTAFSPQ